MSVVGCMQVPRKIWVLGQIFLKQNSSSKSFEFWAVRVLRFDCIQRTEGLFFLTCSSMKFYLASKPSWQADWSDHYWALCVLVFWNSSFLYFFQEQQDIGLFFIIFCLPRSCFDVKKKIDHYPFCNTNLVCFYLYPIP